MRIAVGNVLSVGHGLNIGGADGVRGVGRHESGKACYIYPIGINTALAASTTQLWSVQCVKPTNRDGTNTSA